MARNFEIYKCELCGNIVEVFHEGDGSLVCCGKPMKLQSENTVEASTEKHIPIVEKTSDGIKVKVGSVAHPMEEKHYIEWIELITDKKSYKKHLKPSDAPEATFCVKDENYMVRAYCNLHGLWKSK